MAIRTGYFNSIGDDRLYNADDMSQYFTGLMTRGVLQNYNGRFIVSATEGMVVQVATGRAYFSDGKWIESDAPINFAVDPSDVLLNRIDRIVLRKDLNEAARTATVVLKKGTPATDPIAPALESDSYVEEMSLCTIYVGKLVEAITDGAITDTRPDAEVCGFITGLIQQLDLTNAYKQYQTRFEEVVERGETFTDNMITEKSADFDNMKNGKADDFDTWFESIKTYLETAILIRVYESVYTTTADAETAIPIGLDDYYNRDLDVLQVYVNGMKLAYGTEYSINSNSQITLGRGVRLGTTINFVVYKPIDGDKGDLGAPGPQGPPGVMGETAYEGAKKAGYAGTESEFYATLANMINKFVSLDGSVPMTGDLMFEKSTPYINLKNTTTGREGRVHFNNSDNLVLANRTDDDNWVGLWVKPDSAAPKDYFDLGTYIAGVFKKYTLFGDHTKPNGTYSGNGSATKRTINTGGVGKIVLIFSSRGVVIVTPYGGFAINNSGAASFIATSQVYSGDGVFYIASTNAMLNTSGSSYPYYVL